MLLSVYTEIYEDYSGKLSDIVRSLAFAGIAIIWIFRATSKETIGIPEELITPLVWLALCLAFDLFHYLSGTFIWGIFVYWQSSKNKDSENDPDLLPSHLWETPIHLFFFFKILAVLVAYWLIIKFLWILLLLPKN